MRTVVYARRLHRNAVIKAGKFNQASASRSLGLSTSGMSVKGEYYVGATSKFKNYGTTVMLSVRFQGPRRSVGRPREAMQAITRCILPPSRLPFTRFVHTRFGSLKRPGVGFCGVDSLYGTLCITIRELLGVRNLGSIRPYHETVILTGHSTSLSTSLTRRRVVGRRLPRKTSPTIFICALTGITTKRVYVGRGVRNSGAFFIRRASDKLTKLCTSHLVRANQTSTIVYN